MSPKMKKALSALFIVLSVAAVFCIAFGNTELTDAWEALRRLDPGWLVGLVGCWAAFLFFDVLATWYCLRRQGFSLSLFRVLVINIIGNDRSMSRDVILSKDAFLKTGYSIH